jgi:hypothetical protein
MQAFFLAKSMLANAGAANMVVATTTAEINFM